MHPWFAVRKVANDVWLIAEPAHVNSWLVAGRERAVLIDTGLGIAPIRPLAESLVRVPISVLNTHAHFDHIGGNREFPGAAIHPAGRAKLQQGVPQERLTAYLAYTRRLIAAADKYREMDRAYFFLLDDGSNPRPLPSAFEDREWWIGPSDATPSLVDGHAIDLGGRVLRVIHTPGHSPDSVCLVDDDAGILFAGDTINTGPIYAHLPDSDIGDFASSTARLATMTADLSMVCVSHFGRAVTTPSIIAEIASGFADVQRGGPSLQESHDAIGRPVKEALFANFSILLPD